MNIAVTGASGFIGSALTTALSAGGRKSLPLALGNGAIALPPGVDVVIHLAGIAHRRNVVTEDLRRVNVDFAAAVGRVAAARDARMIFMSSVKVHGEESVAPLREDSPILPEDPYAESKARAEDALRAIPDLRLTILRPPLVYGPGVKANFLALTRALARGMPLPLASVKNRRSLIYVSNLADAVLTCLANPHSVGGTYLASDGASVSTPELCRRLAVALGCPARLFPFPARFLEFVPRARALTRSLEVDDSAIRRHLGWRPPHSLEQGLAATADWYARR